jgi:hypothetical protein
MCDECDLDCDECDDGVFVVVYYEGRFSYRFLFNTDTNAYFDQEIESYNTEPEAIQAINLLEIGYNLGLIDGDTYNEVTTLTK